MILVNISDCFCFSSYILKYSFMSILLRAHTSGNIVFLISYCFASKRTIGINIVCPMTCDFLFQYSIGAIQLRTNLRSLDKLIFGSAAEK